MRIAVVMPVGPEPVEADRCRDTALSILAWEPAVRWIVLVDDSSSARDLTGQLAGATDPVCLPHPLRGRRAGLADRVAAAVLAALEWVARNTDADLVMKLDTDALVIAPFADKLAAAAADDTVGLLGSYDRTCNGEPRSFVPWVRPIKRAARMIQPRRIAVTDRARRVRSYVREGRAAGYQWGEHVLGGALAMPRPALDALVRGGGLDDPTTFTGTGLFDDPILGLLVRRAGYRIAGHVDDGQTFALAWRGLPDDPERLAHRGYSIIHSVKNDPRFTEEAIRRYFRSQRPAGRG